MKTRRLLTLCGLAGLLAMAQNVSAQTFTAGTASVPINTTGATVEFSFTAANSVNIADTVWSVAASPSITNVTFQVFDPNTSTWVTCTAPPGVNFSNAGVRRDCASNGRLRLEETGGGNLPSFANNIFRVRFDTTATAGGPIAITALPNCTGAMAPPACSEFVNTSAARITGTLTAGSITVQAVSAPVITYTPGQDADGTSDGTAEITFPAGGSGTTGTFTVNADGTGGTAATSAGIAAGGCTVAGAGLSLGTFTAFTVNNGDPAGDVDGTIPVQCAYLAGNPRTGTLTCTETRSVGGNRTLLWDIACPAGGATPPTVSYNPAAGSTINFIGTAGSNVTQNVTVNRTANGQAGASVTISGCTVGAGFTFNPAFANIVFPGGSGTPASGTIGVQCTIPAAAPNLTGTLSCNEVTDTGVPPTTTTPRSWPLVCQAPSPEFDSTPAPGTVNFAGIQGQTATANITIRNIGLAPLTITGCAIAPVNAALTLTGVPASPVAPNATTTAVVSCAVPAAAGTSITGSTLTCTTNDADEATVAWPLVCTSLSASIPTLSTTGKTLLGALVLGLGLLGFGLRRRFA
jgi:hypothetical protein